MGIINFEGETYVAFVDIYGFKHFMRDKDRIDEVVYEFYDCGYTILKSQNLDTNEPSPIQGIFVSDCGILFVSRDHQNLSLMEKSHSLNHLLNVVKDMNIHMIEHDVILTTSIAYGSLSCSEKAEFRGISKNPFYGDAYLNAFMDNEDPQVKIKPGECRIVKKNLPNDLITEESKLNWDNFALLRKKRNDGLRVYFYWMVNEKSKITEFNKVYSKFEAERYKKMAELIKDFTFRNNNKK